MRVLNARTTMLVLTATAFAAAASNAGFPRDLGRETLRPETAGPRWAGTTGGSAAATHQVYTVTNRPELIAALNNGVTSPTSPSNPSNEPKIIYVSGTIDGERRRRQPAAGVRRTTTATASRSSASSRPTTRRCGAACRRAARWKRRASLRGTRSRRACGSASARTPRSSAWASDATIRGAWLDIRGTAGVANSRTNIIVRNLDFQDTYDCFPQWAPTDGALGNWNALYDSHLAARRQPRLDRPQHVRGSRHRRRDAAAVLRRAVPGARRPARHHQRLRPRHRLVEPLPQPRQDDADRLVRQRRRPTAASCA